MLSSLFLELTSGCRESASRDEGAAFLRASAALYDLNALTYMGLNVPSTSALGGFRHLLYSNYSVRQKASPAKIDAAKLYELGLCSERQLDWNERSELATERAIAATHLKLPLQKLQVLTISVPTGRGEIALLGLAATVANDKWEELKSTSLKDIAILSSYFHNHILRLNGIDTSAEILVSARELDCLKWTAAGKTAWEASKILGISERTVRFHLNSAREKMGCANTTQAVATAIAQQLISI